jgi:serine/threonine-protein kinase
MKHCPECNKNYADPTLSFCLEDGAPLIHGEAVDEPATAVLSGPSSEPDTRLFDSSPTSERTDEQIALNRRSIASAAVAMLFIAGLAIGGYLYYRRGTSRQIDSIAVLPFVNESGNAEVEYLSDGMTESLINSLSQLPNLNVKARSSVFRYKGRETDAAVIGRELGVQAILNGRVVQRSDGLTLYLELVDTQNGNRIWGDQYDRKTSDLISLQSEIARDVSQKLRTKISGADEQKLRKNYTENVEAYQLYLKGRYHIFKLTPPEVRKGIEDFQSAIALDPSYALAFAGLSDAYRSLALAGEMDPSETLPNATAAAKKAVEIDDDLADGHAALGVCLFWYDWNWTASEVQFKRALELNPNHSLAHLFYAHLLSNIGRHPEELREVKRARELDPLSSFAGALEGLFLLQAGNADEALVRLRQVSELDPNFYFPHHFAANSYIAKGMYVEALEETKRCDELGPNQTVGRTLAAYALAKLGRRDEAHAVLDELLQLSNRRFVPPYQIAFVYSALGDDDKALDWLEKGFEVRDPKMAFLKVESKWNDLRLNPRFKALMTKMAFPE